MSDAPLPIPLKIECSPIRLPDTSGLARLPRHPRRPRPQAFYDAFDARQLYYDVFWHHDGQRVLAIGPSPRNLKAALEAACWTALPSGSALNASSHSSLSTMTTELSGVPRGTTHVQLTVGQEEWIVPIQPNLSAQCTGAKVLFTMNKNNDLAWIEEWARWHIELHGTDTVILFDNGSDRYPSRDIETVLEQVAGLRSFAVIGFPHKFGPIDPAVKFDPYWARFAQISSMSIVLRRLAATADGLLNLDIDELANAPGGRSLYDLVEETRHGLLILPGRWVESNWKGDPSNPISHGAFGLVHPNPQVRESSPVKWILDSRRRWVSDLQVHPYWHWVHKRPAFGKTFAEGAFFWHFRGINTGWKLKDRVESRFKNGELKADPELAAARELCNALGRDE